MKRTKILPTGLYVLLLILGSCEIKDSNIEPDASFVRVYESTNIDEAYYPEDIIQSENDEYLVVSSLDDSSLTNFPKISITALSSSGEIISYIILPDNYTNPVPEWLTVNGHYYFVCMDDITLQAKIIQVNLDGNNLTYSEYLGLERRMPLYTRKEGNNVLILSYDRIGRYSVIDMYDSNFNPQWTSSVSANEDFENDVRLHLNKRRKPFPFFIGGIENDGVFDYFFVNCLANYSMAMLFLEGISGSVTGRLYTYQEETSISSALHLEQDTFALSRFHSGDNYVFPRVGIDINELQNAENFDDMLISQLKADAAMDILLYTINERKFVVYASTSKSNKIVLLFFNAETGEQVYVHSLGYGNPVEIANIIQTNDNGVAVLGKTWINSQYQRMILYKLSPDQLDLD